MGISAINEVYLNDCFPDVSTLKTMKADVPSDAGFGRNRPRSGPNEASIR
jgi:hypothetical protein